jgi:hypothetical protein
MTTSTVIRPSQLPTTIRDYLAAHAAGETENALRTFAPTAEVTDEGHTYRGTDEVRRFLAKAGSQYTYTTELIGAERIDATGALDSRRWVAVNRLEGDFPGGVVELRYRFALGDDDLIAELTIAP